MQHEGHLDSALQSYKTSLALSKDAKFAACAEDSYMSIKRLEEAKANDSQMFASEDHAQKK